MAVVEVFDMEEEERDQEEESHLHPQKGKSAWAMLLRVTVFEGKQLSKAGGEIFSVAGLRQQFLRAALLGAVLMYPTWRGSCGLTELR